MPGPFPQPEINQIFWCGLILTLGVLTSMTHWFIARDQQSCIENRSLYKERLAAMTPERRAAIRRVSSAKLQTKAFKQHYGNITPLFNPTRFGHLVMAGVQTILWPIGLYGTLLGFISLNL